MLQPPASEEKYPGTHWIDTRTDINVAKKGKILPLPGIEPRPFNPWSIVKKRLFV
jgi:hypothetical protein